MEYLDLMTEIRGTFGNRTFRQRDLLHAIDLKNEKRAKKLWAAMRRYNAVYKLPSKKFAISILEKVAKVA